MCPNKWLFCCCSWDIPWSVNIYFSIKFGGFVASSSSSMFFFLLYFWYSNSKHNAENFPLVHSHRVSVYLIFSLPYNFYFVSLCLNYVLKFHVHLKDVYSVVAVLVLTSQIWIWQNWLIILSKSSITFIWFSISAYIVYYEIKLLKSLNKF